MQQLNFISDVGKHQTLCLALVSGSFVVNIYKYRPFHKTLQWDSQIETIDLKHILTIKSNSEKKISASKRNSM